MYILALLTILGPAFCMNAVSKVERVERYILPRSVIPTFYDVTLFIDPENNANFNGEVSITVTTNVRTNEIVMHAMGMNIEANAIQVISQGLSGPNGNWAVDFTLANDDTHLLRILLNNELAVGNTATINIKYTSRYADDMLGLYVSTYNFQGNRRLVTSQLQPTYARRVFPCFDEPAFKATFRTTIYTSPSYTVVRSNMPLRNEPLKADISGWVKYEFEDTPIMPTYLQGYLVSNFENIGNTNTGPSQTFRVPFNIYSRQTTQDSASFALDFGQRSMISFQEYFDYNNYALPKLDKVAVPDFGPEAMENWGLSIYREVTLLVKDGVTSTALKQNVARTIAANNLHSWLGNKVTPMSWNYLWLNKGFTTFLSHFLIDFLENGWRLNDQFLLEVQDGFQSDAFLEARPLTRSVYSPAEILGNFYNPAFQRAGSVIRMLQHILKPLVFQRGLIFYLEAMSQEPATPATPIDLYNAFERALNVTGDFILYPVERIMQSWVENAGFPVITVQRHLDGDTITVIQDRYLINRTDNSANRRFYVPLNWATSSNPQFSETRPSLWMPPGFSVSFPIQGLSDSDWYILNKQQTGYYRVNYDTRNWRALSNVLSSNSYSVIHVLNRAGILDDAFNLARSDRLHYNLTLDLSRYLINETDYIPWGAVNPSFAYLGLMLARSPAYANFQYYIGNITAPLYSRLGFNAVTEEDHVTSFLRNVILDLNCRYGNEHCVTTAETLFKNFQANPTQNINPDIQTVAYCTALRRGDPDDFFYLWNVYRNSTDSSQQSILLNALGCTTDVQALRFYLLQAGVVTDVRRQDRHTIVLSAINSSPENLDVVLNHLQENFDFIKRSTVVGGTVSILNALAKRLTTQAQLDRVNQIVARYGPGLTEDERAAINNIRENIAASITWTDRNAATVEAWLRVNYRSTAPAILPSSLILFILLFITVLNR